MSLELRLDRQTMDLAPGQQMQLTLNSPYLDYGDIRTSGLTIPALPITPRNRRLLGFADVLNVNEDALGRRYDAETYWNGTLLRRGVAVLSEVQDTGVGGQFGFQVVEPLGEFFGQYQTQLLTELNLGSVDLTTPLLPVLAMAARNVVAFPTILNPDYYGSQTPGGYSGRMNHYVAGAYATDANRSADAVSPLVPMPFVQEVLRRVAALAGVQLAGQWMDHPAMQQLLFYHTRALDGATNVMLNRYVPEMTVAALLLELRRTFNLALTFDVVRRELRIDFTDQWLGSRPVLDWSAKATRTYKRQPELSRRLQLGYELDTGDALAKDRPAPLADYLTGVGAEPTGIVPLRSKFSTLLLDGGTGLATTRQPGITAVNAQQGNRSAPRLLFWNGTASGTPTATSELAVSSKTYALKWNGPSGLVAHFWAKTEARRKRQYYVQRDLRLSETDLARLDFAQAVHINGVEYYVASVPVTLPIRGLATVALVVA